MMTDMLPSHPDAATLRLFLLGQLDTPERDQVECHLGHCEVCCRTSLTVEHDDRLVRLLRRRGSGHHGRLKEHNTP
jgi:hypothetical protein